MTTVGPYPISMVGVPGTEVQNTSPPTVALLALAVAHTGLVLLLAALALYPTGVTPQPEIGSASWFAWRPVWVVACGLLLGVLVAVFARFERPRSRASTGTRRHARAVPAAERGDRRSAWRAAIMPFLKLRDRLGGGG